MAYQKTGGRSFFVRPNGMPDLSGFSDLANSMSKLSDVTTSIGTDIRKQEFNDMLIQAEIEGRTAGVRYDENNNLVPLVDTTYASAMKAYGTKEQKALQQTFRKAAVDTYSAQLSIDAGNSAQESLRLNPIDPDAVAGGFKGYIDKLQEDLDPQTYSAVLPRVAAEWQTAIGSARAGRIDQARKDAIATNETAIDKYYTQLGVIATVGAPNDPAAKAGTEKRVLELNNSINDAFNALKVNGVSEAKISQYRRKGITKVMLEGAKANAEKIYFLPGSEGGFVNALKFAQEIETQPDFTFGDVTLDQEERKGVADSIRLRIAKLEQINNATIKANDDQQKLTKGNVELGIKTGVITSEDQILSLPLDSDRISSLLTTFRTQQASQITQNNRERQEAHNRFDRLSANYQDVTLPREERDQAKALLEAMETDVSGPKWLSYVKVRNKIIGDEIKAAGAASLTVVEHQMSEFGGYQITPQFMSEYVGAYLRDQGYIGEGKNITEREWGNKLRTYKSNYEKNMKEKDFLRKAISDAKTTGGNNLTEKQRSVLVEAANNLFQADDEGQILFHKDPEIQDQNFNNAVAFSLKYKFLHPEIAKTLKAYESAAIDQLGFDKALQLYNKYFQSFAMGVNNAGTKGMGVGVLRAQQMMSESGINTVLFDVGRELGFSGYTSVVSGSEKTTSGTRVVNSIESTFGNLDNFIKEQMPIAIQSSTLMESFINNFTWGNSERNPEALAALDAIEKKAPNGNLSSAVINDPRVMAYVRSATISNMVRHNLPQTEKGIQIAIRKAVTDVSSNLGIDVDEDGQTSLTFNSWYAQASASLGANADIVEGGVRGSVFREVRRLITRPDVAISDKLRDIINNGEGTITLVPEEVYGEEQTYSAFLSYGDEKTKVLEGFSYDFKRSLDYKVMQVAVNRVKNSTVKQFFTRMNSLTPFVVKQVAQDIMEDLGESSDFTTLTADDSKFRGVVEKMHSALRAVKPVVGIFNATVADQIDTRTVDAGDVTIIRAWLSGAFEDEDAFYKAIGEYNKSIKQPDDPFATAAP
jgi:hypothetical protein